jgi:diguanylate cyclase (GGDEF)-like protein/PAS domain S-box-containing protein
MVADAWFREMAEFSGDLLLLVRIQPDLALEYALGPPLGGRDLAAEGLPDGAALMAERIHPDDAATLEMLLHLAPGEQRRVTLQWRRSDGQPYWTDTAVRCRARDDGSVVLEWVARDVTAQLLAERRLAESEEKYRLLAENAYDVIWTMALDGSITYVSPAVERVRGITPQEAMAQSIDQIHPPASAASVAEYFTRLFTAMATGGELPVFRGEHEYYRADGSIMTGELQVIPQVGADGVPVQILGVTRDVSERKVFEAELTRLAVTDPLTGVWNRRHAMEALAIDLSEARRYGMPMSIVLLDIDHFKGVNDTCGHQAGDRVLVALTTALTAELRESDLLARWGGEEFLVVVRHGSLEDASRLAERLRIVAQEQDVDGVGRVTLSAGVAELRADETLDDWLGRADRALYAAKEAGRNRVVVDGAAGDA